MVIGSRVRLLVGKLALDLRTLDSSELLNPNVSNPISTHYEKGTSKNGTCTTELAVLTGNKVGDLIFVSGQGPIDQNGKVVAGDVKSQTEITLENFRRVLVAAHSGMEYVLQTTVYLSDLNDYSEMNEAYSTFFPDPKPARATVRADLLFGMKVEIQGIAYLPH